MQSQTEKVVVAVLGATGKQGGSVVRALVRQGGYHVRAITRDTTKKEAQALLELVAGKNNSSIELVAANLDDKASLEKAFVGAHGVFGVTNFWEHMDMLKEFHQGVNITDAAKAAGVKHLIWSSLDDSYVPHFASKAMVEHYIKHSGVPYTALLTSYYFENHLTFAKPAKQSDGSFTFALPVRTEAKFPLYSVDDTGLFVVEILSYPDLYLGKQLRVATDSISLREMAEIFTQVTGHKAQAVELDQEAYKKSYPGAEELWLNMKWFADHQVGLRDVALSRRLCPEAKRWADFVRANADQLTQDDNASKPQ
jgi:uncharacterized protein YbjT (DUF2867 family)